MATLYHIYLAPKPGVTVQQVIKKLNLAVDWYKYGENCWIIKTTSDAGKWQTRLKPLVEPQGSLFIAKLEPTHQRQGWMPKSFWDWLNNDQKA